MKIISKLLISLFLFFNMTVSVFSAEIPKTISDYIKTKCPNASIRFDGLIELPNGQQYLPIFPIQYANVTKPTEIVKSIPENTDISSNADLILFANNFSLLRIIKTDTKNLTLINSNEVPQSVKMGLLPQDLIVPENLTIPVELKVILGDLKIPAKNNQAQPNVQISNKKIVDVKNPVSSTKNIKNTKPKNEFYYLENKTFYITNLQSNNLYISNPMISKPEKILKLSSTPFDSSITKDNRYVLISSTAANKIQIIDLISNKVVKELQAGEQPGKVIISSQANEAFIANKLSSSISVLNLTDMALSKEIKTIGYPINLAISEDSSMLFYNDALNGKIYSIDLYNSNSVQELFQMKNISKIVNFDNYLVAMSRTDNKMTVYKLNDKKIIKTIDISPKPVDIKVLNDKNKIYVLSAQDGNIDIIDAVTFEKTNTINLKTGGFTKNLFIDKTKNHLIVSGVDCYEIIIIDLEQEKILNRVPISVPVNSIIITENQK